MTSPNQDPLRELLAYGFMPHVRSPVTRRRAGAELPAKIAEALAGTPMVEHIAALRERLRNEHWPALCERRAGSTEHGWDALMGAAAVVIELVLGALPTDVARHITETPAFEQVFVKQRQPFQRFAMIVEGKARAARMLVTAGTPWPTTIQELACPPDIERHSGLRFSLDVAVHDGRSHTLLLALLALERWGALALPVTVPLAATGEIGTDGCTIEPVGALQDKRKAWFEQEPGGLFLSAPPRSMGEIRTLLRSAYSRENHESLEAPKEDEPPWKHWIVAGSLEEFRAKLAAWETSHGGREPAIQSWDGKMLSAGEITPSKFEWESHESKPRSALAYDDPILSCLWSLVADRPGPRGIVIYGEPGSGKSVLSHLLKQRFTAGLLGILGFAVRRSARELAEDIEAMPAASLPELLGKRQPSCMPLFHRLTVQGRLILILDGLDEVAARIVPKLARPIRDANAWLIATSRDVRHGHDALPPHVCLKIEPLRREGALDVLRKLGREDLRAQIEKFLPGYSSRDTESNPITTLCRTPFHLRLLAANVPQGARLHEMNVADLYRRAFQGMLEQAVGDGRLRAEQADFLRLQGPTLVGDLALAWLKSPNGILTDEEVTAWLSRNGLEGRDAVDMRRALEFGYLLAPGADNVEFSHRTLAEWAAATAISRRVHTKFAQIETHHGVVEPAERARIEASELSPFFIADGPIHEARFWQLLLFYACRSVAPLGLVEKIIGPSAATEWKYENHARSAFNAALLLAASARWPNTQDTLVAWGFFARARLFLWPEHAQYGTSESADEMSHQRFVEAAGAHLPNDLGALVDIVAKSPAQKATLDADATILLPHCPARLHELFEPLLREGTPQQQATILERFSRWRVAPPWDLGRSLANELPARIRKLHTPATPVVRHPSVAGWPSEPSPEEQARQQLIWALQRVEAALYLATVRGGAELPWTTVQRRIHEWPHHLEGALIAWFCEGVPTPTGSFAGRSDMEEPAGRHRRDAFSLLASWFAEVEAMLFDDCRRIAELPEKSSIANALHRSIDDEDSNEPWYQFVRIARRAGWTVEQDRMNSSSAEAPSAKTIAHHFRQYRERYQRVAKVIKALWEADRMNGVLNQIWPVWAPHSSERRALLHIFVAERQLPSCVSVIELLSHLPADRDGLPYELRPDRDKKIDPKHEQEWRELARSGIGGARFAAVLWCVARDSIDRVDALIAAAPDADPELRRRIEEDLRARATYTKPSKTVPLAALEVVDVPLALRAHMDAPRWRADLLASLEATPLDAKDWPHDLLQIVRDQQVHEALPFLKKLFERRPDSFLGGVIGALLLPEDRATLKLLLDAGMIQAVPERAFESMTIEDLAFLLERERAPFDSFTPDFKKYVVCMGARAHPIIRAAFNKHNAALRAALDLDKDRRFFNEARVHYDTQRWVGVLGSLVLQTVDVNATPMRDIVQLLFEVIGGDRHDITSTPGPLGSDYDEPHDMEYSSHLVGADIIRIATELFIRRSALHPEEVTVLEGLLEHPSETLHLLAFEEVAKKTPPHEVARLAVRALEAHVRSTDTRMQGETLGVFLATTVQGGSGSIDLRLPEVGRNLALSVRRHLTHADRGVLVELTRHRVPAVRELACHWIGDLGTPEWAPALVPAIEDESSRVTMAALQALNALDPKRLAGLLAEASRNSWSGSHYRGFIAWYMQTSPSRLEGLLRQPNKRPNRLPNTVLQRLAIGAVDAVCFGKPADFRDRVVPSQIEEFVRLVDKKGAPPQEGPFSNSWLHDRARQASVDLQAALYRILAQRGALEIETDLQAMALQTDRRRALLAAEVLPTLRRETPAKTWIELWDAALQPHEGGRGIYELWPRLLYMLERAPVAYAVLAPHLLVVVEPDLEGSLTEESEEILSRLRRVLSRWGPSGAEPLIDTIASGIAERNFNNWSEAEQLLLDVFRDNTEVMARLQAALGSRADLEWKLRRQSPEEMWNARLDKLREDIWPQGWLKLP